MMDFHWMWICFTASLLLRCRVRGQCGNSTMIIRGGHDWIVSPNNKNTEYGKSENCSWELNPPLDGRENALLLKIEWLALYVEKNGRRLCLGSYNLTINEERIKCDRFSIGSKDSYTNAYFSEPACSNNSEVQTSENQQLTSQPIRITYFSDGRTDADVPLASMGFDIEYKFIDCSTGLVESKICDASGREIQGQTSTSGTIQAKEEKNCVWEFSPPPDGKAYAIKYYVDFLGLKCDSTLTINNESFTCNKKVRYIKERFRKAYYSSATCESLVPIQDCETRNETSYPLIVSYSGTKNTYGFVIRYEFVKCAEAKSSTLPAYVPYIVGGVFLLVVGVCIGLLVFRCKDKRKIRLLKSRLKEDREPLHPSSAKA